MMRLWFAILTMAVALVWVAALWRARPDRRAVTAGGMLLWLLFTGALGFSGLLQNFDRVPPPMAALVVGASVLTAILAWSPYGTGLVASVPIPLIAGFQVFRLGVEILLWGAVRTGLAPPRLSFEGRNWDVLTGLTALPVAWLFSHGRIGRTAVAIWNVAGLCLLLNVVAIAVLSFPTPIQQFTPSDRFLATLPYVWLPAVLVQAAWFSHLILFRQLAARPASL